jgi:hypothetical protein
MSKKHTSTVAAGAVLAAVTACGPGAPHAEALGTSMSVGYYPDSGTVRGGTLDVTVTGVRKGSVEEMAAGGFTLDDEQESATPYYIAVSYHNTGSSSATDLPDPNGEADDGTTYPALVVVDAGGPPYVPCPATPSTLAVGQTVEGCAIVLVPRGGELDRISYFPGGTEDFVYWKTS